MASLAQLQQDADDWLLTIQEGCVRLRRIVEALSAKGRDWHAEGPAPQLDDLIDWPQAKTLMQRCYAIFTDGRDLCDAIEAQAATMASAATTTPAGVSSTIHTSAAAATTTTTTTTTTTKTTTTTTTTTTTNNDNNDNNDNNNNDDDDDTRNTNYTIYIGNGVGSGSSGDDDNNNTNNNDDTRDNNDNNNNINANNSTDCDILNITIDDDGDINYNGNYNSNDGDGADNNYRHYYTASTDDGGVTHNGMGCGFASLISPPISRGFSFAFLVICHPSDRGGLAIEQWFKGIAGPSSVITGCFDRLDRFVVTKAGG
ncbi:hypothetical protein CBR_g39772 [Chara braunii]|uniref:Uncharacterized protein n=1 Tax=Chara braunii TaxID=69332 RepID=A0A388LSA7_CHABU|nr:hypothetical protein CBR_g39772 [Chara braunii]|eukprot:GBG85207.1 hypothetical protein CBR_g39772 [Chara braunii]